jgi:hypothetical protein
MPRLRMNAGINVLPLYTFMACTGTTLPLPLLISSAEYMFGFQTDSFSGLFTEVKNQGTKPGTLRYCMFYSASVMWNYHPNELLLYLLS